ncbi:hypothetical protein QUF72_11245 [Desulfobacterales bacterium HSG2]|nr:hypothetical protein [Desulfobacterales bacterium HSG2]
MKAKLRDLTIVEYMKQAGAHFFRGGAFKPRTFPYSFQGFGKAGLEILAKVRETTTTTRKFVTPFSIIKEGDESTS